MQLVHPRGFTWGTHFLVLPPVPAGSVQFKARLVRLWGGRNEPGSGGRGCGHSYAKASLFKLPLVQMLPVRCPAAASQQRWRAPEPSSPVIGWCWLAQTPARATAPSDQTHNQTPRRSGPSVMGVGLGAHSVPRHPEPGQQWSCRTN